MARISKVKRIPGFLGRKVTSYLETVNGRNERRHLEERIPELVDYNQLALPVHEKLHPLYEEYISTISTGGMALSLEASVFMSVLCQIHKPKSILDLGSGFSSAAFRLYAMNVEPKPHIVSIDDSQEWLDKTGEFLTQHNLEPSNLITWESFLKENQDSFDFILHDLGSMKTREKILPEVLSLVSHGGVIVLDDIHKKNYRKSAKRVVDEKGLIYHNLKSFTQDRFERYCGLVTP